MKFYVDLITTFYIGWNTKFNEPKGNYELTNLFF